MSIKQEAGHDISFYRPLVPATDSDHFLQGMRELTSDLPDGTIRYYDKILRIVLLSRAHVNRPVNTNPSWAQMNTDIIRTILKSYKTESCDKTINLKPQSLLWLQNRSNADLENVEPSGVLAVKFSDIGNPTVKEHKAFVEGASWESGVPVDESENPGVLGFADQIPKSVGEKILALSVTDEFRQYFFRGNFQFAPVEYIKK